MQSGSTPKQTDDVPSLHGRNLCVFVPEIKNALDTHIQEIKAQVMEGKCDLQ